MRGVGQEVRGRGEEKGRTKSLRARGDEILLRSDTVSIIQDGVSYGGPKSIVCGYGVTMW